MPEPSPHDETDFIAPGVALRSAALSFTFSRGGGPGGQSVNKVNTHATMTVAFEALHAAMPAWAVIRLRSLAGQYLAANPDRLVIHASDSRSQRANRRACVLKLRALLIQSMNRPRVRRPTRPSARAKQRRLDTKKHRSKLKNQRRPPD